MAVTLSSLRWPSLAHDLAVLAAPGSPITDLTQICSAFGITDAELNELLKIPLFQQQLRVALEDMKAKGSRAGAMYRANALAQGVSEKLYNDFVSGEMKTPDALKFLDLLFKASGMMDKTQTQVAVQVNNGIQIPMPSGLDNPKFQHLMAAQAVEE